MKKLVKAKLKVKGGVNFLILIKLSSNLYSTFQNCTLYTRKVSYYHTLKSKGGVHFTPPYATFTPPFERKTGYFSALKHPQKEFFTPPFSQKSYQPALHAGLQGIGITKGGVKPTCFVLKGGVKGGVNKYATFHRQEVIA